jgi:hypothetical protein
MSSHAIDLFAKNKIFSRKRRIIAFKQENILGGLIYMSFCLTKG